MTTRVRSTRRCTPRRGGVAVMVVLLSLTVVMTIAATWGASHRAVHDQRRRQEFKLQAGLLAEAALGRARAQLQADRAYAGETWRVDSADLADRGAGQAVIRVESPEGEPSRRRVSVSAAYPADRPDGARVSRQATFALPKGATP